MYMIRCVYMCVYIYIYIFIYVYIYDIPRRAPPRQRHAARRRGGQIRAGTRLLLHFLLRARPSLSCSPSPLLLSLLLSGLQNS